MARNDGGPAFPLSLPIRIHEGMSLRDYFAGQVVGGFANAADNLGDSDEFRREDATEVARIAYLVADCLLTARAQEVA